MTEKELRKLKRVDLLEILVEQGKKIETLQEEIEGLQKKLNDRTICIDKAGNIAEASLQLNGIFEAAHTASAQYLENIQQLSEKQEKICAQMQQDCREKCEAMERETAEKCEVMLAQAEKAVEERWAELSGRLEEFYDAHKGIREMMVEDMK